MLATTRAPTRSRSGSSSARHASTPGFCRPTLLSMPAPASCTRGAGFPAHGVADNDFTTTAPSLEKSRYRASSVPRPAVPEASMTGLGRVTDPTWTVLMRSIALSGGWISYEGGLEGQTLLALLVVLLERPHFEGMGRPVGDAGGGRPGGRDR